MKRNPSIELYRVGLMLGICLLHSISFGLFKCAWVSNILASCVVGFVFISGWFGVKFSWYKLLKLYGIGQYAALVFGLLSWLVGDVDSFCGGLMLGWHKLTHGFWFLHAYAVMMMFAPLVNALIDGGGADFKHLSFAVPCVALGLRQNIAVRSGTVASNGRDGFIWRNYIDCNICRRQGMQKNQD